MKTYTGLEIAIIGMSGRFPGAETVEEFWENIKAGKESVDFFSDEELIENGEDPNLVKDPMYVKANAYLKNKEYFDSTFFEYRPDEALLMDPQMRIFHECVWEAMEDAGCIPENFDGKIGVFAGAANNTNWVIYSELLNQRGLVDTFTASKLNDSRYLASRISYKFNLKGPAVFIDTACSTSLVAIEQACKSLILGDCRVAISGGVTITNKSKQGYIYQEGMILSSDGHCRAFDEKASGTMGSEGAAVLVLKMLKHAIADGDHIYSIIRGSGINNDGSSKVGFTAPSVDGQSEAILMAHKWAKIDATSISYIETHGTGTKMGDPIEIEGLKRVFGNSVEKYCGIGSLKTNVGHLDMAAGAASVIKTSMALKNRLMPPSINFNSLNSSIDFVDTPFYINTELKEWNDSSKLLRAGVSAFGIGGTNAHIILEEGPDQEPTLEGRKYKLLTFSAKNKQSLDRNIQKFIAYFDQDKKENLSDIAYTLQTGRTHFPFRKTVVVDSDTTTLVQLRDSLLETVKYPVDDQDNSIVFMFSGQGSQYLNMCKDLYGEELLFRETMDTCFSIMKACTGKDLKQILFPVEGTNDPIQINRTENTQPLLFSIEYSLAKLLEDWGISPSVMLGHSIGEYVAACLSGIFSLEDALKLVVKRGELMQRCPQGDMLSVSATEEEIKTLIGNDNTISIAAVNSTRSTVVAGTADAIKTFVQKLDERQVVYSLIHTSHAFHSYLMDGILEEFRAAFKQIRFGKITIPIISNLTGKPLTDEYASNPDYWVNHLRNTVRFADGVAYLLANERTLFLEVGPGNSLKSLVASNKLRSDNQQVISLTRHPRMAGNDVKFLVEGIADLWKFGINPNWKRFYQNETRRKVSLPTYAFEKLKYPVNVDSKKILQDLMSGNNSESVYLTEHSKAEPQVEAVSKGNNDDLEERIAEIWRHFFGKYDITFGDDFFNLGGDSLKATTLIVRLNRHFKIDISLSEFFNCSTIAKLTPLIEIKINNQGEVIYVDDAIGKAPILDWYPLSSAQKRMYFLSQMDAESVAYNLPQFIRVSGKLDKYKLLAAVEKLVNYHEVLRTTFDHKEMQPVQFVRASMELQLEEYASNEEEVEMTIRQFVRPFDLHSDSLLRIGLIHLKSDESFLLLDVHHIISDGLSQRKLLKDLLDFYAGKELNESNQLNYIDYAYWEQNDLQQKKIVLHKQFWLELFADELNELTLQADFERPVNKTYTGASETFELDEHTTSKIRELAKENGVTTFTLLLSLYVLFLSKTGRSEDVVLGTPSAGRLYSEVEDMIGMFANTVTLRYNVNPETTYNQFLQELNSRTMACFDHQKYPYEALIDDLKLERRPERNPLFETFFSFQNIENVTTEIPGLQLLPHEINLEVSQFDLQLWATEKEDRIQLRFDYATAIFKPETITNFVRFFKTITEDLISKENPALAEISLILPEEEKQLITTFSNNVSHENVGSIVDEFEKTATLYPAKTALIFELQKWSYQELNDRANQLAQKLVKMGIGEKQVVGILLNRSTNLIVSMLAILKSGAAYLPIDPEYPLDRIQYIIDDSRLNLILTDVSTEKILNDKEVNSLLLDAEIQNEQLELQNLDLAIDKTSLAYIIYTSGSTGKPKGVAITHSNVVNFSEGVWNRIELVRERTILSLTTASFDIFVLETLVPLMHGGTLVLATNNEQKDLYALESLIREQLVDTMQITPSHLKLLLASANCKQTLEHVKTLIVGGEAFPETILKKLKTVYKGRIFNMYGPTETTVWSTVKELTNTDQITIGTPLDNTALYVVDAQMKLLPFGIPGELCIGGNGVAFGYWNNPELTNERFITDLFNQNQRVYRTGDLVKYLANGEIAYLGRMDQQVKLRGFRIELGEIENVLLSFEKVKETVVLLKEINGENQLIAYYVSDELIEKPVLRELLSQRVPHYMIPDFFIHQTVFPLTPNGKLDRKQLPNPAWQQLDDEFVEPSNDVENALVEIWSNVLNLPLERISVRSNFFELGGHSLKAAVMINEVNTLFDTSVALTEIFNKQTIESLADYLITINNLSGFEIQKEDIIEITL